jgi:hypothetical protein
MRGILAPVLGVLIGMATLVGPTVAPLRADDPEDSVHAMLRPLVTTGEATSHVLLERSDPFGGPPDRERGRIWYLPGRGFRYRSERRAGQDVAIDREHDAFLLYSPSEHRVYRAPFARAPIRIRHLIVDPERILAKDLHATPERRTIHGVTRSGYRLRTTSLGDSSATVSTWIAADPRTGLPRWIAIESEADSVLVELQDLTLQKTAKPHDITISAPKGTPEEPLDPRDLLGAPDRGESR